MSPTVKETDPLDRLEERIQRAVALVNRLRDEKEAAAREAVKEREAAAKDAAALRESLEETRAANTRLSAEMEAMREERQQVRTRLEKLLGHIDQLGAA
jgi:uncharacterized coiled-coil DUF342 family protein